MANLKHRDTRVIDDAFDMHQGYVLNFSDRTFAEFFFDELQIDIDEEKYRINGGSKAKRLRTFLKIENDFLACKVIRTLWVYKESLPARELHSWDDNSEAPEKDIKTPLFELIERLEDGGTIPRTDAFDRFTPDETLEELISAIERDISANKPAAALDRLHTYSMKKTSYLIQKHGGSCGRDDPLHSRMGKYVKLLEEKHQLREISKRSLKSAISIFDSFNDIRNNESFAHDNDIVDHAEARYIFDSVSSILRFIKKIEADDFGT